MLSNLILLIILDVYHLHVNISPRNQENKKVTKSYKGTPFSNFLHLKSRRYSHIYFDEGLLEC